MNDAGAPAVAVPPGGGAPPAVRTSSRRRVLGLVLLLPAAVVVPAGCATLGRRDVDPDPLVALADAARADAALAARAIAADAELAARLEPLRSARAEHAVALDAEVARVGGAAARAAPTSARPTPAAPTTPPSAVSLAEVREAVAAAQRGAADLVPGLPVDRVGLVAAVAACCATYASVLT